jgi:YVTN family beta-propeller protein
MKGSRGTLLIAIFANLLALAAGCLPAHAQPFAYVTDTFSNTVSVIDTTTNTVVAIVPVGSDPFGVAITPNGAFAYVADDGSNAVSVINTASNTVVATVPVGSGPSGVAITPNEARVYSMPPQPPANLRWVP